MVLKGDSVKANKYQQLLAIKKDKVLRFRGDSSDCVLCPAITGRVFAEVCGQPMHRIDLDCVAKPDRPFNNFGGANFWPAPEGGKFAFHYRGNEWYVQECLNQQPYEVVSAQRDSATIEKTVVLTNRLGTKVETLMKRDFRLLPSPPALLKGQRLQGFLSYQTADSFTILNELTPEQVLIGAWTLEQFDASETTVSFCAVRSPQTAINFDFYKPPVERITYYRNGFTYQTDGLSRAQIGVKKAAGASCIGFHDLSRKLLCLREIIGHKGDLYFNMADNDQPGGPFSAADNYSIFNADADFGTFFELETLGGAHVENGFVKGSELVSLTTFAMFEDGEDIRSFVAQQIGG